MRFDLQRAGDHAVIVTGGQLTYSHAGLLHRSFLEACAGADRIDLFFNEVLEADLTFLQLLCAVHRTVAAQGTVFTIGGLDADNPVRRLIGKAGAERGAGCPEGCLWAAAFAEAGNDVVPARGQQQTS